MRRVYRQGASVDRATVRRQAALAAIADQVMFVVRTRENPP
jgi:hypothetical protein